MEDLDTYRGVVVCPSIVLLNCQTAPVDKHAQVDNGERLEGVVWKEALEGELPNPCPPASSRNAGIASFMLLASSSGSVKAKRKKEQRTGKCTGFGNC